MELNGLLFTNSFMFFDQKNIDNIKTDDLRLFHNFVMQKNVISFKEFTKIVYLIEYFNVKPKFTYNLKKKEPYVVIDPYILDHQSRCNNLNLAMHILKTNHDALLLTYRSTPRLFHVHNICNSDTFDGMHNYGSVKNPRYYASGEYNAHGGKYDNLEHFIVNQKTHRLDLITYPFDWFDILTNTDYNLDAYGKYELISNPHNRQCYSNLYGIKMIIIDIDGSQNVWYKKIITENNLNFNHGETPLTRGRFPPKP